MATPLDSVTQAAVGAFAGLVEVTVQQVRPRMPPPIRNVVFWAPGDARTRPTLTRTLPLSPRIPSPRLPAPSHAEKFRSGRSTPPLRPRGVVPRMDRRRADGRPDGGGPVRRCSSVRARVGSPASPTVDADVTDRTGTDIETETHPRSTPRVAPPPRGSPARVPARSSNPSTSP